MVEGASRYPRRVFSSWAPRTWLAVVVVARTYAARVRAAACGIIGTSYVHGFLVAPLALHLLAEVIVLLVEIVNPRLQLKDSVPQYIQVHRNMSFMGRIDPAGKVAFRHLLHRRVTWFPLMTQAMHVFPLLVMAQTVQLVVRFFVSGKFPAWFFFLESVVAGAGDRCEFCGVRHRRAGAAAAGVPAAERDGARDRKSVV